MVGYGLFDEKDNGFSGDFFNDVIAFLDFPMENVEGGIPGGDWDAQFQGLEPLPSVAFDGNNCNANSELAANLSVSCDETSRLEQLPNFVEDPSSGSIPLHNDSSDSKQSSQFQTSSPVSVLESSSSCSVEKTMPVSPETVIPVCTPTKHPLPSTLNPQHVIPLISSTASASENVHPSAASESFSEFGDVLESHLPEKILNSVKRKQKKKKKKKLSLLSDAMQVKKYSLQRSVTTQKCMHCEVTKTPQWRNGPMGPKTLCNACGVRYRSGRLFPEYRPAASPTYVASLHSNSHKVVIEMRNNTGQDATKAVTDDTATDNAMSPLPEFIPMSSYLFD